MKKIISNSFALTAMKPAVSFSRIDNYYLTDAKNVAPSAADSRWVLVAPNGLVPVPTDSQPYLWHKQILWMTDGTQLDPIIEFAGMLGASSLSMDLSDEQTAFPTTSDGRISSVIERSTAVSMNYGTQPIKYTLYIGRYYDDNSPCGDEVSASVDYATNLVRVQIKPSAVYKRTIYIDLVGNTAKGSMTVRYTISPVAAGKDGATPEIYQLYAEPSSLNFVRNNANQLVIPSNPIVYCKVKKFVGNQSSIIATQMDGYSVSYSFDDGGVAGTVNAGNGQIVLTRTQIETYQRLQLKLNRTAGAQQGVIDVETIPIIKDGNNGEQGKPGNGVVKVVRYRAYTPTLTPPAESDPLWIVEGSSDYPAVPSFTQLKNYLWEKKVSHYADGKTESDIYIIATADTSETRPQLLSQTGFDDDMSEWDIKTGGVTPAARGAWNGFGNLFDNTASEYAQMLRQQLYKPGVLARINPSEWYTLSFWVRDRKVLNKHSNVYGFAYHRVYLRPGTYRLQMNGRCSKAARQAAQPVKLAAYLYNEGWTNAATCEITTMTDSTADSPVLTVSKGEMYNVTFYAMKGQGTGGGEGEDVYVNWFRVVCLSQTSSSFPSAQNTLLTYVYSSKGGSAYSCIDTTAGMYIDGALRKSVSDDAAVQWPLNKDEPDSGGWTRHWCAFKTKSAFPDDIQYCLFRQGVYYCEVTGVKLERGIMPTEWCPNENDSTGGFSHNVCGTFKSGTRYYYWNGQRDVVRALASAEGGSTWFRMRRRTTSEGYNATAQPYLDTEHWERANNLKFTIVDAMFADEIFTDKLTVSCIRSFNKTFVVDKDGNIQCNSGNFKNITVDKGTFNDGQFNRMTADYGTFKHVVIENDCSFYGFVGKKKLIINKDNIQDYVHKVEINGTTYYHELSFDKCGPWIDFYDDGSSLPGVVGAFIITLPGYVNLDNVENGKFYHSYTYVGLDVMMENHAKKSIGITGPVFKEGESGSPASISINPGEMILFGCRSRANPTSGLEEIYWTYRKIKLT